MTAIPESVLPHLPLTPEEQAEAERLEQRDRRVRDRVLAAVHEQREIARNARREAAEADRRAADILDAVAKQEWWRIAGIVGCVESLCEISPVDLFAGEDD